MKPGLSTQYQCVTLVLIQIIPTLIRLHKLCEDEILFEAANTLRWVVLLNSTRVNEKNCPPIFDSWDQIYFEDVAPTSEVELVFQKDVRDRISNELAEIGFESNLGDMSSPWVGMNFLSIDPETVIVDERQDNLIALLEKYNFTVIPVCMRHIYTQGGGIHCATLDTVRESKLESYFD